MRQQPNTADRRLAALGVGLAALLLVPGCQLLHPRSFQKATNPRVCPACAASTPQQCNCFPSDLAAGYSETRWGKLPSPDLASSGILLQESKLPAPRLFQVERAPIEATAPLLRQPAQAPGQRSQPPEEIVVPPIAPPAGATDRVPPPRDTAEQEAETESGETANLSRDARAFEKTAVVPAGATAELPSDAPEPDDVTVESRGPAPRLDGALPDAREDSSLPPVMVAKPPDNYCD